MKYELAKELKDAGFPQGCLPFYCDECKKDQYNDEGIDHCSCFLDAETHEPRDVFPTNTYIPTLSELIGACGAYKKSFTLQHRMGIKHGWQAQRSIKSKIYATPEEAVARLWLALNKKPRD